MMRRMWVAFGVIDKPIVALSWGGCCILTMPLCQAATMPLWHYGTCHYARLTHTDSPSAFPFQPIPPSALHKIMPCHGTAQESHDVMINHDLSYDQ